MKKIFQSKFYIPLLIFTGLMFTILRLVFAYSQFATITPPLAPLDDDFMFRCAVSIVNGDWFGEYNFLTLSKHNFFSIWLSFLHILNIPYLVGNTLLYILACLVSVFSLSPVLKNHLSKLVLYLALLYNPAMWANYATRVYRDSIFPSLCLIFFACIIGYGLRYKKPLKEKLIYFIGFGISFALIYLTREDGIWVIPFFIVAFIILMFLHFKEDKKSLIKNSIMYLSPFLISALIISLYAYQNYSHYDRFIVSDFTSSEFEKAYGALISIENEDEEWQKLIPVSDETRFLIYDEVSSFNTLKSIIETPEFKNGYYHYDLEGFPAGAFYWVVRDAAQEAGYYENALSSKDFYNTLYNEIVLAVNEGRLSAISPLHESLTPPIKMDYVLPVITEAINGMKTVIFFEQCDPTADMAVGTIEEIQEVENFIHQKGVTSLLPYTTTAYLNFFQQITFTLMKIINFVYKIIIPIMLILSIFYQIKKLLLDVKNKEFNLDSLLNIILLGVLLMAILRSFMIAYVEVASFNIGTYIMYLSSIHPLIILYATVSVLKLIELFFNKNKS